VASKIEQLLEKLCPDGVEYKPLGELCRIRNGSDYKHLSPGRIPVYGSGGVMTYVDKAVYEKPSVLIPRKGSIEKLYYVESPFWTVDTLFYTEIDTAVVVPKFLYYLLQKEHLEQYNTAGGVPSLTQGVLNKVVLPLPPIEIQRELVEYLDNFALLEAELEAELAKRKKQYEHYRRALLCRRGVPAASEKDGSSSIRRGEDAASTSDWPRVKLGEVCEIGTGSSNTDEQLEEGKYPFYVRSQEVRWKNEFEYDDTSVITSGDGVGVGKIFHYATGKYALHQRAYRIHPISENLNAKYLYYYFKTEFLDYINKSAFQSSVTSIRKPMLLNFEIPLPPLEEQRKVVSILDRFDSLCNSLSEGLPAEIERRKKQYAYYRDKLLDFKRKGAA